MNEASLLQDAARLFPLEGAAFERIPAHEGGRNILYLCTWPDRRRSVLRISPLPDRTEQDYLAETGFVRYLRQHGVPVAGVIPSCRQRLVEKILHNGQMVFLSLFEYAKGMLISDNGYRYREDAPLEEYFINTGRTLGILHRLSKQYTPEQKRAGYPDKYSHSSIDLLIPDHYAPLKAAIHERLDQFARLPTDPSVWGLIHFDFSDGNYHIDMETGDITVFDFDNCLYCWYMFDLANLWTHGEGWCRHLHSRSERAAYMRHYFDCVLTGYRTETALDGEMLRLLPLFVDMVLIENIVDEFECCAREGRLPDEEDIHFAAVCLIHHIPLAGLSENTAW